MNLFIALVASLSSQPQLPDDPLAPVPDQVEPSDATPAEAPPPAPLVQVVTVPRDWRGVFDAIRSGQWASAQAGIAALPAGPLTPVAKAELYTARNSPKVAIDPLLDLLIEAPDLPKADQLQRMAEARGGVDAPAIAPRYGLVQIGASPRRTRARPITGEPEADRLRTDLEPYVKVDDALNAELLTIERAPLLSPEARAEAAQRVAWIHYVRGDDANARRVAEAGRLASSGEWGIQNAWVSALASWRQNDCSAAAPLFRSVAQGSIDQSLQAGGFYWAARAEMACRRPASVSPLLRAAARYSETFYGMLARRTLGMDVTIAPLADRTDPRVEALPNVRRAVELVRIGERDLAGQYLRYQARLGRPGDQLGLITVARRLDLAATQHYLAHFAQPGAQVPPAARYPRPSWSPRSGWRIDPALPLAHTLQETSFRSEAVSPAGAVGLMQIMPGTMATLSRLRGIPAGNLKDPATNMEFGQAWIEMMRGHPATGGHLPKVIASYNAGSLPVGRWQVNDRGDPLLWMESIPYWETRFYVPTVLRNMWIYEGLEGRPTTTLTQMAQHKWPTFPASRR